MRLLNTHTGLFVEMNPEPVTERSNIIYKTGRKMSYAVLSHTWDAEGEQTYEELRNIQRHYDPKFHKPRNHPNIATVQLHTKQTALGEDNHTLTHSQVSSDGPPPLTALRRLPQSEVEALFRAFAEKYHLPNPPDSLPSIPESGASSGEQDARGPSSTSPLSAQPPSGSPSATTPPISRFTHPKTYFAHGMARLRTWVGHLSARNASHLRTNSPLVTTPPQPPRRCYPSRENDRSGPSLSPPSPPWHWNDSGSPPSVTARPQTAVGRLSKSELEVLFRTFVETYDLTNPIPLHAQSLHFAPSYQFHTANDHPSGTPGPSSTSSSRLTQSEVDALFYAFGEAYGLTGPTLLPIFNSIWDDSDLSPKIREACRVARENGYRYIWIDSCCIDKSSSSELSEAINSMYKWYGLAAVCYAYLADVPAEEDHRAEDSAFCKSRWFRRGWTLQELIAPVWVEFLSQDWAPIGSKHTLADLVESITKINHRALSHLEPLDTFSVAQRLSWAAERETTRVEDRAYSLLGIFDINMPTLYGEGDRAFRRLQEQIMQCIPDRSLFAWEDVYLVSQLSKNPASDMVDTPWPETFDVEAEQYRSQWSNLFATSPSYFKSCNGIKIPHPDTVQLPSPHLDEIEYTFTPHGIRTQFPMIPLTVDLLLRSMPHTKDIKLTLDAPDGCRWYLAILGCEHADLPGHLLGRVCYVPPSKSSVEFVYTGLIRVKLPQGGTLGRPPDLFPLSPDTIKHYLPQIERKTIYIPHPDISSLLWSLRRQPYTTIKLVLLKETCEALRLQGYSADLHNPNPDSDYPTTHWLTLSNIEHTITVKFQHTLKDDNMRFTIKAKVKMSGSRVRLGSPPDSDPVDWHFVSWSDYCYPWQTKLDHERVKLSAEGDRTLTVDLGLDFAGHGYYFIRVDVLSKELPGSSAV